MSNVLGIRIGDYTVVRVLSNSYVVVECISCKNQRVVQFHKFKNMKNTHSGTFCHDTYYKSLLNTVVGDFRLVSFKKEGNRYTYNCQCIICNTVKEVPVQSIYIKKGVYHNSCQGHLTRQFDNSTPYMKQFKDVYFRMRKRTTNKKSQDWSAYGGRGISSEYYKDFNIFYNEQWENYLEAQKIYKVPSIERINVEEDYEKDNICWIENSLQAKNRRNNKNCKAVSPKGEIFYFKVISDFAKEHHLDRTSISACLHGRYLQVSGWFFEYTDKEII